MEKKVYANKEQAEHFNRVYKSLCDVNGMYIDFDETIRPAFIVVGQLPQESISQPEEEM